MKSRSQGEFSLCTIFGVSIFVGTVNLRGSIQEVWIKKPPSLLFSSRDSVPFSDTKSLANQESLLP